MKPRVTIHYAQTLDGRIATNTGQSQWISDDASLGFAHRLRSEHDGILVGVGTIVADNPRLTVRLVYGQSPRRIVADSTLRLPCDANVLTDGSAPTILATTDRADPDVSRRATSLGAEVLTLPRDEDGRVDLHALFSYLYDRGIHSILVEGGSEMITAVLRRRLADRLVVCIAPKIIGEGIDAIGDLAVRRMPEAVTFTESRFRQIGADIIFEGRF